MIYPSTYERKIGFNEIRQMLRERCNSSLGGELVETMEMMTDAQAVREQLALVSEFRRLKSETEEMPLNYFFDLRLQIKRIRLEGTHLEEEELFDLRRLLETIADVVKLLRQTKENFVSEDEEPTPLYPKLCELTDGVDTFPLLQKGIDKILDKFGKIKDTASVLLLNTRRDLRRMEGTVSAILNRILREAQRDGLIDKDVTPAMRDGRLVLPVNPAVKRKINGIVHDESATGKTVFIEPAQVVEANNRIRDLENEERKEIINILKRMTAEIRPNVDALLFAFEMLAKVDFVQAKAALAEYIGAIEPVVEDRQLVDWGAARHPLLQISLKKEERNIVPLDITLTHKKRILIISGPNAGGKSVCLKTVGLLQYMLQMGLSIPVSESSKTCVFDNIFIDIGDEQSIENDLSTYSGHLLNMKNMMKNANAHTLILIDEFGTGTEPAIGGAIAEAVLEKFCKKGAFGVITTHYQNLKHFADSHEMVANGAMLYDRHKMEALFQLAIGRPGSSFAVEIARKIGLSDDVIKRATELVGSDYIDSDKYLQDIVRDKRYWESKRQNIHQQEKQLEKTITNFETNALELEKERKAILRKAKQEAQALLDEANKKIENTIREIKEAQAEKEKTRIAREELRRFQEEVQRVTDRENDEKIARKMAQIQARRERHAKRQAEKAEKKKLQSVGAGLVSARNADALVSLSSLGRADTRSAPTERYRPGDTVKMKGMASTGTVEKIDGKNIVVLFNGIKMTIAKESLEPAKAEEKKSIELPRPASAQYRILEERNQKFRNDLDIRGFRADDAMIEVSRYVDDAILIGASQIRILHGTGTGALRQIVRQYLATVPDIKNFHDEHVQFGGAGITVAELR